MEQEFQNPPAEMTETQFMSVFGGVYEHSPWIPQAAWKIGLTEQSNTLSGLSNALSQVVASAEYPQLLNLINAHPDLAGKAAIDGDLTEESSSEQSGAGIDQCTAEEFQRFQNYNAAYKQKFGFPFIMAVKGSNRHLILEAFEQRIKNDEKTEFNQAITEINKIAKFRLKTIMENESLPTTEARIISLKAEPLTKTAFAPYGDVIETEGAKHFGMNDDGMERFYDLASIDVDYKEGGKPVISLTQCNKVESLPYHMNCIERHPRGSQAFIPMTNSPLIVAVAEPAESVDVTKIKAFVSNGRQGINYNKNVWHMPTICLDADQRFIIIDRGGKGDNCDLVMIEHAKVMIDL